MFASHEQDQGEVASSLTSSTPEVEELQIWPSCYLPKVILDGEVPVIDKGGTGTIVGEEELGCVAKYFYKENGSVSNDEDLRLHFRYDKEGLTASSREASAILWLEEHGYPFIPRLYSLPQQEIPYSRFDASILQMRWVGRTNLLHLMNDDITEGRQILSVGDKVTFNNFDPRYRNSEMLNTALRSVGEALSVLHSLPPRDGAHIDNYISRLSDFCTECIRRSPKMLEEVGLTSGTVQSFLSKVFDLTARSEKLTFIHNDFWPANIMVPGGHEVYFVDWENAGTGIAALDLSNLWYNVTLRYGFDFSEFESSYGLSPELRVLMYCYLAVRSLHFLHDTYTESDSEFLKLLVRERAVILKGLIESLQVQYPQHFD